MSINGTESPVVLLKIAQKELGEVTNRLIVTYDSGFKIWLRKSKISLHHFDRWEHFCIFVNGLRLGSKLKHLR